MKSILAICGVTVMVAAAFIWRAAARPTQFGTFTGAPRTEVAKLIAKPEAYLKQTVQVDGTISEQCKAMGCFFFFKSGQDTLRVDIQEVAMTAPMREGRRARVEGRMTPYDRGYQLWASAVEFE